MRAPFFLVMFLLLCAPVFANSNGCACDPCYCDPCHCGNQPSKNNGCACDPCLCNPCHCGSKASNNGCTCDPCLCDPCHCGSQSYDNYGGNPCCDNRCWAQFADARFEAGYVIGDYITLDEDYAELGLFLPTPCGGPCIS